MYPSSRRDRTLFCIRSAATRRTYARVRSFPRSAWELRLCDAPRRVQAEKTDVGADPHTKARRKDEKRSWSFWRRRVPKQDRLCQMNLFVVKSGEEPLNIARFSHVEWHFHPQSGEERQKIT